MAVVVKQTRGNHYKVHRVSNPEGGAFELPKKAGATSTTVGGFTENAQSSGGVAPTINATPINNTIRNKNDNVKTKFSMSEPVEKTDRLIAWHNMNEGTMRAALDLGGLAMPSFALKPSELVHDKFGDYSIIARRETVDPELNPNAKMFNRDAWTPLFPDVKYMPDMDALERIQKKIDDLLGGHNVVAKIDGGSLLTVSDFEGRVAYRTSGDAIEGLKEDLRRNTALKCAYLKDIGEDIEILQANPEYPDSPYVDDRMPEEETNKKVDNDKFYSWIDDLFSKVYKKRGFAKKGPAYDYLLGAYPDIFEEDDWLFEDLENGKITTNWEESHYDYTLYGAVEAMSGRPAQGDGESDLKITRIIIASAISEFDNIEEARKNIDRLIKADKQGGVSFPDMEDACHSIRIKMAGYGKLYEAGMALIDTLRHAKDKEGIRGEYLQQKYSKEFKIYDGIETDVFEFCQMANRFYDEYFEAKLYGKYTFDEAAAILVPDNGDPNIEAGLRKVGANVLTYEAFADKMRAADIVDDVMVATTEWLRDGGLKHQRKDNIKDFAHGEVLIQAGDNQYSADVVVGITDIEELVLYDVVKIKPAMFKIIEEFNATAAGNKASSSMINPSEQSITNNKKAVKDRFSCSAEAIKKMIDDGSGNSVFRDGYFKANPDVVNPILRSRKNTNADAFASWFKKSRAVNRSGEPLLLFHGTDGKFTKFE